MSLYKCECCEMQKEISKATIVFRNGEWVTKEAKCKCGKYMKADPEEGMPTLIRTEASLSKKKRHNKLWASAKEKLVGERGINEDFK